MKTTIILAIVLLSSIASARLTPIEKDSLHEALTLKPVFKQMIADIDSEIAYALAAPKNKPFYFRTLKYLKGGEPPQMDARQYAARLFNIRNRYALREGRNYHVIWRLTAKEKE